MNALQLAILFHKTYERLAPQFGYETRAETRKFDPTTPNGQLMVAVCDEIITTLSAAGCMFANGSRFCEHGYNGICHTCDAMQTPPRSRP